MFRRFFGVPEGRRRRQKDDAPGAKGGKKRKQMMGLGSGVVVSPEGHILTNNHVIEGADEIIVTIGNGKHEYKAKKIGTDPSTDIAVLKIEPTTQAARRSPLRTATRSASATSPSPSAIRSA